MKVKIARTEDIQPGDHVTLVWNDDIVSGIVRTVDGGHYLLDVAGSPFCLWLGSDPEGWHVTDATREVADLPSEP